jgi:hypothetical protein
MNEEFPFTKEYLRELNRDTLVKLAQHCGIIVRKNTTNERIIEKLWDKYYPEVIICDSSKRPIRCERHINDDGDEIIVYKEQVYNLSKMSVQLKRILEYRILEGL